jgi:hypothetical protein
MEVPSEPPAFLCEKVSMDVDLKKVADMAVDDLIQRQNVLYISRGQLKKHISTMINFNISVRFISQQVSHLISIQTGPFSYHSFHFLSPITLHYLLS